VGFALTYLIRFGSESAVSGQHYKGSLALLCASPLLRNHGVGTALHSVALDHLEKAVKGSLSSSTPPPPKGEIQLGSIFPRIFPGLPEGPEFEKAKAWFGRRGWVFKDSTSIDLYQSLIPGHPPDLEELMGRAKEHGFTFGPPKPEDDEGLYELEKTEFDSFTVRARLSLRLFVGLCSAGLTVVLGLARHVPRPHLLWTSRRYRMRVRQKRKGSRRDGGGVGPAQWESGGGGTDA